MRRTKSTLKHPTVSPSFLQCKAQRASLSALCPLQPNLSFLSEPSAPLRDKKYANLPLNDASGGCFTTNLATVMSSTKLPPQLKLSNQARSACAPLRLPQIFHCVFLKYPTKSPSNFPQVSLIPAMRSAASEPQRTLCSFAR